MATLKTDFINNFNEVASVLNENLTCHINEEDLRITSTDGYFIVHDQGRSIISRLCFITTLWWLNEGRLNWYVDLDILKDESYQEKFDKLISYVNSKTDKILVCID